MSSDSRRRVEALFEAALSLPPEERETWLSAACGGDEDVRTQVLDLLAAHQRPDGILDSGPAMSAPEDEGAVAAHDEVDFTPPEAVPDGLESAGRPEMLGAWRILKELASGGMGVVYLAERADGQYRRVVALKVIRGSYFTDELYRRFTNERQILASLNHPNIARLFGGGRTPAGRPYLAMEYIDGLPINEYCARPGVTLEQKLRLFCAVARAVHHAHRNLVVHRDLKPSNILVEGDGTPKLLDFGIAKILDPEAVQATGSPATQTGVRLMTPEYASPEQVIGGPITTAADVYALGIILYEMLTGTRPFRMGAGGLQDLERRILHDSPDRPSSVIGRLVPQDPAEVPAAAAMPAGPPVLDNAGPHGLGMDAGALHDRIHLRRLRQQLRGDLDRIVLMALRKEPDLRYPSAEAFAADVERYLAGQPVTAQRSSRRYRAAKFIRRHRVQTLAASAVVAALAIGAGISAWQARRAEQALRASEAARSRSEDVTALLLEMFEAADPMTAGGDTAVAREILRRGLARVEELQDQPLVQAEMLFALGRIHYSLGRYEQALELFDRSLELRRDYLGPRHPDVVESMERVAWLYRGRGDLNAADSLLADALSIAVEANGANDTTLVPVLRGMARVATTRGLLDSAGALHRRVLSIETAAYGPDDPRLAFDLHRIAGNLRFRGFHDSALVLYREALGISVRGRGPEHQEVAGAMLHLADELQRGDTTDYAESERLYLDAMAMQRRLFGDDYPNLSHGLGGLAEIANKRGRYEEADDYVRQVLDLRLRTLGPDNAAVAHSHRAYGDQRAIEGDYEGAIEQYRIALPMIYRHLGSSPDAAGIHQAAAAAWVQLAEPDSAIAQAARAIEIYASTVGPENWRIADCLTTSARAKLLAGRFAEAERDLLEARRIFVKAPTGADDRPEQVEALLSELYDRWNREPGSAGGASPGDSPGDAVAADRRGG